MGTNRIERAFRPFNLAINAVGGNGESRAEQGGSKALLVAFIKRENSYGGDDGQQRSEMGWPLPHPAASSNQAWHRFQPPSIPSLLDNGLRDTDEGERPKQTGGEATQGFWAM